MLSKIIHYAAIFFTGVVLTRSLSKTDYGTFSQVILVCIALSLIIGTWLGKSIYYFLPQTDRKKEFMLQTYMVVLGLGLAAGVGVWLLRFSIAGWFGNTQLAFLAVHISLYMLVLALYQLTDPFFISVNKAHIVAMSNIVFSCLYIFIVSYVLIRGCSLGQLMIVIVLLYLALILFVLGNVLKLPGRIRWILNRDVLAPQIRYAAPLCLSTIIVVLGYQIDKYVIAMAYSTTDFAVYHRGAIELPFIEIITFTIYNMLLPRFVRMFRADRKEDFMRVWHEAIKKTAIILFPLFVLFFFVSERFITLLYTQRYASSAPIFRVYLLIILIQIVSYDTILQATGKTREILYASTLKLVFSLVMSLALIRIVGPIGAAVSLVVGHFVATLYYLARIRKIFRLTFARILPWIHLLQVLALALGLGALTYTISLCGLVSSRLVFIGVYGAVFSALYTVLIFKFKFMRREDLAFLKLSFLSRGG